LLEHLAFITYSQQKQIFFLAKYGITAALGKEKKESGMEVKMWREWRSRSTWK